MVRIRPEGGLTGKNAYPDAGVATGMWTLRDVDRNVRNGNWPLDIGQADPYFNLNTLLIHADGTSNANNSTVVDSTTNKIPFSDTYSVYFDGASYATLSYNTTNFDWYSSGTDYTIEFWINPTSGWGTGTTGRIIGNMDVGSATNFWSVGIDSSNQVTFYYYTTLGRTVTSTETVTLNAWNHIAITKTSSGITIWVNGVGNTPTAIVGSPTSNAANPLTIGVYNGTYGIGYISNLRIVKGSAVYSNNFTPPTSALTAITNTKLLTCQSSTFIDNSTNAYTITTAGSPYTSSGNYPTPLTRTGDGIGQGSFSPYSHIGWSYYGTASSYAQVAYSSALDMPGDFTVEAWIYRNLNSQSFECITGRWSSGSTNIWQFYLSSTGTVLNFALNNNASTATASYSFAYNTWYHVAAVRSGTTITLYINGVATGTPLTSITYDFTHASQPLSIGRNAGAQGTQNFVGYISNLRIVQRALYTSDFSPSKVSLTEVANTSLLTCAENRFMDESINNLTVTNSGASVVPFTPFAPTTTYSASSHNGSYSFDGVVDYMRVASNNAMFGFGTGDYTIECWAYFNTVTGTPIILDVRNTAGTQNKATIYFSAANTVTFYHAGANRISSTAIAAGEWYHIAVSRQSSNTRLFMNGVQQSTTYNDTSDHGTTSTFTMSTSGGGLGGAGTFINAYLSDIRVLKGVAAYTANFTPPTAPLTANSVTSFLLNGTNAGIIDQTGKSALATVGGARLSTTQSKFGGTSIYLNGTTDFIKLHDFTSSIVPGATLINSGDFTIEGWFFSAGSASTQTMFQINGLSTAFAAVRLDWTTSNTLQLLVSSSGSAWAINYTPSGALNTNQWYHIAIVRSGTSFSIYVDGILKGAAQTLSGALTAGTGFSYFGALNNSTMQQFFNGYMDELRISRYARYTSSPFDLQLQNYLDR